MSSVVICVVQQSATLVGKKLYGFCNGFFGDHYGEKVIIASGEDWLVALEDGYPVTACFRDGWQKQMAGMIEEWSRPENYTSPRDDDWND